MATKRANSSEKGRLSKQRCVASDDVNDVGLDDVLAGLEDDDSQADGLLPEALADGSDMEALLEGAEPEASESWLEEQSQADADAELPIDEEVLQSTEKLDLSQLDVSAAQARLMAPLLAGNDALIVIHFEGHDLSIADLKDEEELEWDSEEYSDIDAIFIAEFLKSNTSIKRLDLARNQISDEGASALAQALCVNTSLEYLNLESNAVAHKGGVAMYSAAEANTTLQYLNLSENAIPRSTQQELRDVWVKVREGSQLGLHL